MIFLHILSSDIFICFNLFDYIIDIFLYLLCSLFHRILSKKYFTHR